MIIYKKPEFKYTNIYVPENLSKIVAAAINFRKTENAAIYE